MANVLNWFFWVVFWVFSNVECLQCLETQKISFCFFCSREQKVLAQKYYCTWALCQELFYMTKTHQGFLFASFGPTFVFQLFSLRTLCLRHDSKLRFLFVMTLLHIFSGICWSWSAILPPSNINCLLYWYYLRSSRKYSSQ